MEVILIQMGTVLQGETGGKDLSTTKWHAFYPWMKIMISESQNRKIQS
ncbi:hypothetical protein M8C21_000508 [Ambrosia artemisiifolia]|uniref:Uncharacterized protein n=1 Tax=Ambrosia artemisiifolia TaxID=4212 RepID=A0AAD5CD64_AMBAR|nr:hypothetical protein M8C21_000508 [Ambrosia artemisiifolia]